MADQEQLQLLRQDIEDWNTWREQHPEIHPDLRGANLRYADLNYADLNYADLRGTDLSYANLSDADLSDANLSDANLSHAVLFKANLFAANLNGANLNWANLSSANLSRANLCNRAELLRANLIGANLSQADLESADFWQANLSSADLSQAYLVVSRFFQANLNSADLSRTDLRGADLSYAKIGFTIFGDDDLRTVKGLETVEHDGPSTIGTDTLVRSQGNIPESFLRRAGLPDTFLTYIRSLVGTPIQYYTCFLSYSSKDQEFVERLHADLQNKGVRCWFAPHDLRPGTWIRPGIDEAIRMYDKLILILSENAIASGWVQYEAEIAMHKERERNSLMLFPIRIDQAIMISQEGWAMTLRARHIGDFTRWEQHKDYQQAFTRLLRDLQPPHPQAVKP